MSNTPIDVLESYKSFLKKNKPPAYLKKLKDIEKDNSDGAIFEAIVYSILQSFKIFTEIGDNPKSGGTDFICKVNNHPFSCEATIINNIAMERQTRLKHDQRKNTGGFFQPYQEISSKLENKVKQLSRNDDPGIVFIGTFHNESRMILLEQMADWYLSSFLNKNLQEISAFILVGINIDTYSMMGFLNPKPKCSFDIKWLPGITFRKMTKEGLEGGNSEGEWTNTKDSSRPSFSDHPLQLVNS